jgi:hypothetical protein
MARFSVPNVLGLAATLFLLTQCGTSNKSAASRINAIVSVRDQKMGVYQDGELIKRYNISTSKFGCGDRPGSCCTPLGKHQIVAKIGQGLPAGAVLKSRHWNGEVLKPNAPGRDPIVSRILWLSGMESSNKNAYGRFIYIHGTTEEHRLGSAASYGCVRMAAKDVIELYGKLAIGSKVTIVTERLPRGTSGNPDSVPVTSPVVAPQPIVPSTSIAAAPAQATATPSPSTSAATTPAAVAQEGPAKPASPTNPATTAVAKSEPPQAEPKKNSAAPSKPAAKPSAPSPVTASTPAKPKRLPGPGVILKSRG